MQAYLFTIVTVTYNSSKWVRQAIESVLASEFTDFEYIIADDCSTDDTWEIIRSYPDTRIKAFRQETNLNEYQNRNFALGKASGEYLLFVDGDDELYAGTLRKLAAYIAQFPGAGSIWGISENQLNFCRLPLLLSPSEISKWIFLANIRIAHIGLAETLFKTALLKSVGGFSTKFVSGDTHMKKILAMEAPVLIVPAGFVYWRVSDGQASSKLSANYNGFRNNVAIDKDILARMKNKNLRVPVGQIEKNIKIRNIKLLLKHTLLKGKVLDCVRLYRELQFRLSDFRFLFMKGNYDYLDELEKTGKPENVQVK